MTFRHESFFDARSGITRLTPDHIPLLVRLEAKNKLTILVHRVEGKMVGYACFVNEGIICSSGLYNLLNSMAEK